MAQWQAVGFCHGVMNTDNLSILGLTIDYGPFGFLDAFDPAHICNHSDHQGRYAYARQPGIAWWNLHALAQAVVPLLEGPQEQAAETLADANDMALIDDLLRLMAKERTDYTIAMRRLGEFAAAEGASNTRVRDLFIDRDAFDAWAMRYSARLRAEGSVDPERRARMQTTNPKYVLRNHLAEQAIRRAQEGDFTEVARLAKVLRRPFDEQPEHEADAGFPPDWAGTLSVSCSS
jgi:uncharacterized protein YdiU (UPF0061 family)